jgi:curli biogenesis system outer membrane secretion channel CsgG
MKIDDNLSQVFNMEPIEKITGEIVDASTGEIIESADAKIESDYDKTRANLLELLSKGQQALTHALDVAKSSEHPRAFEVVGNLMKQVADINTQLMDLHQQKQKLDAPKEAAAKNVTNNAIFVGSTSELNKLIEKMNKGD